MRDVTRNDDLGFLTPFVVDRWIEGDPTVEMRVTLHLLVSSKAINSGPPLIHLTTLLLRHPNPKPICFGALLSLHSKRLVMSSSSSSPSSSLSSSSYGSSTTEPLSFRAIQTFLLEDSVRVDDPEGVVDRSNLPEESSHLSKLK